MRRILLALSLSPLAAAADGAVELTNAADVRARREATRDRNEEPAKARTQEDRNDTSSTETDPDGTAQQHEESAFAKALVHDPPPGSRLPFALMTVEQGWYGMEVGNGTEASAGPGSLGRSYHVGYEIEPFAMTRISGMGRVDRLGFSGSWASDPTDRAAGEALSLAMMLFTPDDGGWWQGSVSWARLRGTATTADSQGDELSERVDSRWRTYAIERRYYPLWLWGVQYEALAMPSAYSLDDPDGQVIAIFDDSTRWHTVSVVLGIDSGNAAAVERRPGLRGLYEVRLGLGAGVLSYDSAGARSIAESYDYGFDDDGGVVLTVSGEVALGVQATLVVGGAAIDVAFGGRVRGVYLGTGEHSTAEGEVPDYDTLRLTSELTTATYGVFVRGGVTF